MFESASAECQHTDFGYAFCKFNLFERRATIERAYADSRKFIAILQIDAAERRAFEESVTADGFKSFGKHDVRKRSAVSECVVVDGCERRLRHVHLFKRTESVKSTVFHRRYYRRNGDFRFRGSADKLAGGDLNKATVFHREIGIVLIHGDRRKIIAVFERI